MRIVFLNKNLMTLEEEVDEHNHHVSEESGLHPKVHVFQRKHNPLTLYRELTEIGFNNRQAKVLSMYYEKVFYKLFTRIYKQDLNKFQERIKS